MTEDASVNTLIQQYEILLAYLQRPAVQVQLLTILIAVVVAYVGDLVIERFKFVKPYARVIFPLLTVFTLIASAEIVESLVGTSGFVQAALTFFGFLLVYMIAITIAMRFIGAKRLQPVHRRVLLPLLLILTGIRLIAGFFDLEQVGNILLVDLVFAQVTVARLLGALLWFYFILAAGGVLLSALRSIVLPRTTLDVGAVNAVITITRYFVIGFGILLSLGALGVDLTSLALIGGGLSIGIGFGLQQIIANFLSGILLLFEQSLRPGDIVNVDGDLGTVEQLSIRSTTVRTFENVELIIPNETFLTTSVKNYTRTSEVIRGDIRVGVSYNSDPVEVRRLLLGIVSKHGVVLKNPEPLVFFVDFGSSSLDFWILFWVPDISRRLAVATDLRMMIWQAFQTHNIEIPFPQRDLHIRSGFQVDAKPDNADATADVHIADQGKTSPATE